MKKIRRTYSPQTLKILFALSGNRCAYPDCTNRLIELATENSDALVVAQICHIHAVSPDGPRGEPSLTQEELNSPDNLILLCRNHHAVVDGQYETYPAETLREWKQRLESEMERRLSADPESLQSDFLFHPSFPTELFDRTIEDEIQTLRKVPVFRGVRQSPLFLDGW